MSAHTPGPWIIHHYHAEADNRSARFVSRDGGKGWPECLTTCGQITLGGTGPNYCFVSEAAAQAAIAKATRGAA